MKFYQTINQPPRSVKDGKHRRTSPPAHSSAIDRADYSTGGAYSSGTVTVSLGPSFTWFGADFANDHACRSKPSPPAIPYAGIRTGEIIGHRLWWYVDGRAAPLCSLAHVHLWVPGATEAGDVREPVPNWWEYQSPLFGGVYAYANQESIHADLRMMGTADGIYFIGYQAVHIRGIVVGTVKMWGEVIEHERGYRAQFAKVNSLDRIIGNGDLDEFRALYGVPPTIKATDEAERT